MPSVFDDKQHSYIFFPSLSIFAVEIDCSASHRQLEIYRDDIIEVEEVSLLGDMKTTEPQRQNDLVPLDGRGSSPDIKECTEMTDYQQDDRRPGWAASICDFEILRSPFCNPSTFCNAPNVVRRRQIPNDRREVDGKERKPEQRQKCGESETS